MYRTGTIRCIRAYVGPRRVHAARASTSPGRPVAGAGSVRSGSRGGALGAVASPSRHTGDGSDVTAGCAAQPVSRPALISRNARRVVGHADSGLPSFMPSQHSHMVACAPRWKPLDSSFK